MCIRASLFGLLGLLQVFAFGAFAQSSSGTASVRFEFREPRAAAYRVDLPGVSAVPKLKTTPSVPWVTAWPDNGSTNYVQFGSRVVLEVKDRSDASAVLAGSTLRIDRTLNERTFILQAPDVATALREAQALARDNRVAACYPVSRRLTRLNDQYAPKPNDPFFFRPDRLSGEWQANLENRDTNGVQTGVDLNVRSAWTVTRGEDVIIALGDDGVELDHPDLVDRVQGTPHFNFISSDTNGMPAGTFSYHATAVAGLVAATANNKIGISGVAPAARLASWVIFDANDSMVSDELLMDMFQYQSNVVSVQNHSWGKVGTEQLRVSSLEDMAISNAVTFGRAGRGVVIVRAAGNGREDGNDVNEDGYLADPRVIAVAAVRQDGQVTRYSSPGACVFVAAPSGDVSSDSNPCLDNSPNLVTTDRQGARGYNKDTSSFGRGDYTFGAQGFSGTSGATPQISGVVGLILSANPFLTYRDVQQVLINSSRQTDPSDSTLATNGAGLQVSHNLGFGVPDAGLAVRLARHWINRPAARTLTFENSNVVAIPDLGLTLQLQGDAVPDSLRSIVALPGGSRHPDVNAGPMPVVDVGSATNRITADLHGKIALIRRGVNFFCEKINLAAQAGAALAVVYNNTGGDNRIIMAGIDAAPIPAVFISQTDGEAIANFLAGSNGLQAQAALNAVQVQFDVPETLQCEFVGVNVDTDHNARGDLRIVLTSPSGTSSVLQRVNQDNLPGPSDWTYYSVQHFYESSFGTWTLTVADENDNGTGSLKSARLMITGVRITDADHDGLDDAWELAHFQTLAFGPKDDPDHDGYSNAREQVMGTDPNASDSPVELDLSVWDSRLIRLSWPSNTNTVYRLQMGAESIAPLTLATNIPGRFPETEWFIPYTSLGHQFFQLQAVPRN